MGESGRNIRQPLEERARKVMHDTTKPEAGRGWAGLRRDGVEPRGPSWSGRVWVKTLLIGTSYPYETPLNFVSALLARDK